MSSRPAALVTGASRGIGSLIADELAADGFDLTITARSEEALAEVTSSLASRYHVDVIPVACDMASESDLHRLAGVQLERRGSLDLIVLNAGMGSIGPFADFPATRLDKLLTINFRSAYVLVQAVLPLLRAAGQTSERGGKVVAVASTTGVVGEPGNSAYGASKAALISLCETVSAEESPGGVTATAICPGYVATDMTKPLDGQVDWSAMIPPSDVAAMVVSTARLSKHVVVPQIVMTRPGAHLWRA